MGSGYLDDEFCGLGEAGVVVDFSSESERRKNDQNKSICGGICNVYPLLYCLGCRYIWVITV